jgi:hypothetical protein
MNVKPLLNDSVPGLAAGILKVHKNAITILFQISLRQGGCSVAKHRNSSGTGDTHIRMSRQRVIIDALYT